MLKVEPHLTDEQLAEQAKLHREIRNKILSIRAVFIGEVYSCSAAAKVFGVDPSTITRWLKTYNAEGIDGLFDKKSSGRPRFLVLEREEEFKQRIIAGPREDEGLSNYRGEDIRTILKEEFECEYSLSGVYLVLDRLKLSKLVPRPEHPGASEEAREEFKKTTDSFGRLSGRKA